MVIAQSSYQANSKVFQTVGHPEHPQQSEILTTTAEAEDRT